MPDLDIKALKGVLRTMEAGVNLYEQRCAEFNAVSGAKSPEVVDAEVREIASIVFSVVNAYQDHREAFPDAVVAKVDAIIEYAQRSPPEKMFGIVFELMYVLIAEVRDALNNR